MLRVRFSDAEWEGLQQLSESAGMSMSEVVRDHLGVLGIFRPKTTKNAEALTPQSLQEGITFPEVHSFTLFG
jgi:hypothetical protein